MRSPIHRRIAVLLAVLPLTLLVGAPSAHAQSAEALVVETVPAGFEAVPAGDDNGPLDKAAALKLFQGDKEIKELFDDQDFESGFMRTWTTADGANAIISAVFVFGKDIDADDFLDGAKDVDEGTDTFDIPDVPNAVGLSTSQFQLASYAKKNQIFLTIVSGGTSNRGTLLDVVRKHDTGPLAQVPEAKKESFVEKVAGGALLGGLIGLAIFLVRRVVGRRGNKNAATPAWAGPTDAFGAPGGAAPPSGQGFPPPSSAPGEGYAPPASTEGYAPPAPPADYPPPTGDERQ